jgi:hypothetical protein
MFLAEDHRNSSMNLGDEIVGLPGYDCTGAQPLLIRRIFPTFPETGKDERRIVFHPDRIRDFASDDLLPFVESVARDQAAPFLECLPIRGVSTVSRRALIVLYAIFGSFAQYGINPHCKASRER